MDGFLFQSCQTLPPAGMEEEGLNSYVVPSSSPIIDNMSMTVLVSGTY